MENFHLPVCGEAEPWWFLASGACGPAWNMAWDEALLEAVGRLGHPVLRTYGWAEPCATFGYFQRHAEVAARVPLRPLTRRPTGGGIVPHDGDWTYSVAVPPGHPWHELPAVDSYRRVHQWIQVAFASLGVQTVLSPCCDRQGPGECFVGAERHDLMLGGRKIGGAAQRRNRLGLLLQGSVQPPPPGLEREAWEISMKTVATESSGICWNLLVPDTVLTGRVRQLAQGKYASDAHNLRR